uniref:Uncharacterized protein n=1 Tax=Romanomermis culicivorax TaxID=13658 RepID=A0A915JNC4_ROMCU
MLQNVHEDGTLAPQSTTESPKAEISQMETKLKELEFKLKKCRDKRVSKTAVHRQRCTIIFHADVVALPLNDCANPMENSILSD